MLIAEYRADLEFPLLKLIKLEQTSSKTLAWCLPAHLDDVSVGRSSGHRLLAVFLCDDDNLTRNYRDDGR